MPAGHPSPYAGREIEIATAIAERLRTGEPLAQILRENNQPVFNTLKAWRAEYPEIDAIIACARDEGFDAIAADCLVIADASENDSIETEHGSIPNGEWIQRSKLRVETRLKLLAKWDPKRYGDAIAIENHHSGGTNNTLLVMSEERRAELRKKKQQAIAEERV